MSGLETQLAEVIRRGTAAAIDMPDANDKMSKDEVDYGEPHDDDVGQCGTCQHYENHACNIVDGEIDPEYLCDEYKARRSAAQVMNTPMYGSSDG